VQIGGTDDASGGDEPGGADDFIVDSPRHASMLSGATVVARTQPERGDRLSTTYEMVFLFTRSPTYFFDLDAIRIPHKRPYNVRPSPPARRGSSSHREVTGHPQTGAKYDTNQEVFVNGPHGAAMRPGRPHNARHPLGKNPGDVWHYPTRPLKEAHFAAFPIDIPLRCIAAGCRPGGTVLDPFSGAATTGLAALQLRRHYTGIDLSPTYAAIAKRRLNRSLDPTGANETEDV
jgi:site-specific DNA-methyltransferase (cytosine-N4-specific)